MFWYLAQFKVQEASGWYLAFFWKLPRFVPPKFSLNPRSPSPFSGVRGAPARPLGPQRGEDRAAHPPRRPPSSTPRTSPCTAGWSSSPTAIPPNSASCAPNPGRTGPEAPRGGGFLRDMDQAEVGIPTRALLKLQKSPLLGGGSQPAISPTLASP